MKWNLDNQSLSFYQKYKHLIPEDFDYDIYIQLYADLQTAGITTEEQAKQHYLFFGMREGRYYKLSDIPQENSFSNNFERWYKSKNILYFSPTAPDYDSSSGGNRLLQILKILSENLKYNVYFFCNSSINDKYISILHQSNIKTYCGNKLNGITNSIKYLSLLGVSFDYAFFSWYDIGNQYIDIVREYYPDIKIITDSVDIHWLREARGVENKEIQTSQRILEYKKDLEKDVYLSSNVVYVVTENDKDELASEIGAAVNIKILSNIHDKYDNTDLGNDILFIGNYAHTPNIGAAKSCIDIFRRFKQTQTYEHLTIKPRLLLVGPNADKIQNDQITDEDIIICGRVEDLETVYKPTKVLMAPLYWGAGIKGKICDASMRSIPILTSDIGNEGIGLIDGISGFVANDTDAFVSKLETIYSMTDKDLYDIRLRGRDQIDKIVSRQSAISVLKHTLQAKHIVISIVTYNKPSMVEKCVKSILSHTRYPNYTIYISDNSENFDIENIIDPIIKQHPDKIIYHKNTTNLYFVEPNNMVIAQFPESDIVLVNDDIEIISECWLSFLYSSAYSASYIGAAGGKTIYPTGQLAEAGAELYNTGHGRNIGRYHDPSEDQFNIIKYVGYCSGCLMYMKREVIDKIGPFDSDLSPMYYEDSEWQYRAHIAGFKTIYDPRCVAIHSEGSSAGTDINVGMKRFQEINRQKFVDKFKNYNIEQYNNA